MNGLARHGIAFAFLAALACPAAAQDPAAPDDRAAAQAAFESGDLSAARRILDRLVIAAPDDPDLLRRLAAVQAAAGDLANAARTIGRARMLAPADPDIQLASANILLWRGELGEARRLAGELAQTRASYPGLAEFAAAARAAEDARRLRLHSASLGAAASRVQFASGRDDQWLTQQAAIAVRWNEGQFAAAEIEREDRGPVDTRIAVRADLASGQHRLHLAASITPHADFRDRWSVSAGADWRLSPRTRLLASARYANYRLEDAATIRLGLRQQVARDVSLTGEAIQLFGGGADFRLGGSVRADYAPARGAALFALVASYPDTEADGTRQLRSAALGGAFPLGERWSLRLAAEHENRADSFVRNSLNIGLTWSLGG